MREILSVGRTDVADEIDKYMTRLGYVIRSENPFEDDSSFSFERAWSPYATRIKLMWEKMRKQILGLMNCFSHVLRQELSRLQT